MAKLAIVVFLAWSISAAQIPLRLSSSYSATEHSQGYEFDPLLHLPGLSPYFDAIGAGLGHEAPRGCKVTAASYLMRHAAIYANDRDWEEYMEPFLQKLNSTAVEGKRKGAAVRRKGWNGPLGFLSEWESPYTDIESQMEQVTPQGKKDSKKVGEHLLSRYQELVPTTKRVYVDKKARTRHTAEAFVKAFPQEVEIVEIDAKASFHEQVPHKACSAFSKKPGDDEVGLFLAHYGVKVVERLQKHSPVDLEVGDVMALQMLCGYESAISGKKSEICDVFTDAEWLSYEYAWDLKYSYMVGHGNPLSPYLGFPWLNTTAGLFSKFHAELGLDPDDDGQRFFISFTHREVPPFIATALGLFNSSSGAKEEFPTNMVNWSRSWKMAELIPFLGHVGIEKMTCDVGEPGTGGRSREKADKGQGQTGEYVRIIANSAPRPIPVCQAGPGASCPFEEFLGVVGRGMERFGDREGVCEGGKEA